MKQLLVVIALLLVIGCTDVVDDLPLPNQQSSYEQKLCHLIEPSNPEVRGVAVSIARDSDGSWQVKQLVDLFLWMDDNVAYVNDPSTNEYFASASETLELKAGDCDDQAVLITSMVRSVGGSAKIIAAPDCGHAFAAVFISSDSTQFQTVTQNIEDLYLSEHGLIVNAEFNYYTDEYGYWLFVDPAGGVFLGDLLDSCKGVSFEALNC